ncbi:MAG: hypothetical protein AAF591_20600 [Verrucomicrobiota bacterium]
MIRPLTTVFCTLVLSIAGTACTTTEKKVVKRDALKPPTSRVFVLAKPFDTKLQADDSEITDILPPGTYVSQFRDSNGEYFEAPFTPREQYLFSKGVRGGVYLTDSTPREARTYFQDVDTEVSQYYAYGVGAITFVNGPTGTVSLSEPLPKNFLDAISIR